jgi:TetR/AcrR family transcriptional regulator, cholesterol catabolism regulator
MTESIESAPLPIQAMTSRQLVRRAERAGIALGTVYRYFSSKDHLLAAALCEWQERLARRVLTPRAAEETEASGDLTERVLSYVRKEVRGFARNPKIAELMVQVHVSSDPYAREALARMTAINDEVMAQLLAGVPPERAQTIKYALGSILMSNLVYWVTGRESLTELTHQVESVTLLVLEHALD